MSVTTQILWLRVEKPEKMTETTALTLWVVYDSPIDLPGRFVARKWLNETPTAELLQGKTLDELRSRLPGGLYRLDRDEADDPRIVETWI